MEHSPSWEATCRSASQRWPSFVEPEFTLPCSREPAIIPCSWATYIQSTPNFHKIDFNIFLLLPLSYAWYLPFSFTQSEFLRICFLPMHALCTAQLIHDLITVIISSDVHKFFRKERNRTSIIANIFVFWEYILLNKLGIRIHLCLIYSDNHRKHSFPLGTFRTTLSETLSSLLLKYLSN